MNKLQLYKMDISVEKPAIGVKTVRGVECFVKTLIVPKEAQHHFRVQNFLREIQITSQASSLPFVVSYVPTDIKVTENHLHLFCCTRRCANGDLHAYVRGLSEQSAQRPVVGVPMLAMFFYQIVTALACLHRSGIAHGDVKLENIFLESAVRIAVGDFDLSFRYARGTERVHNSGTKSYCAPEKFTGLPHDPEKTDVWSVGVCMFAMFYGALPRYDRNKLPVIPDGEPAPDDEMTEAMRAIFVVDTATRASFDDLMCTELFKTGEHLFKATNKYTFMPDLYTFNTSTGFVDDDESLCGRSFFSDDESPGPSPRKSNSGGALRRILGSLSPRGKKQNK